MISAEDEIADAVFVQVKSALNYICFALYNYTLLFARIVLSMCMSVIFFTVKCI